jgi:hypothetical protein
MKNERNNIYKQDTPISQPSTALALNALLNNTKEEIKPILGPILSILPNPIIIGMAVTLLPNVNINTANKTIKNKKLRSRKEDFTNYDNSLPYETTFEYFNSKLKDDGCENGFCGFSSYKKLYSQYSSNECRTAPSRKYPKSKYYKDLTPKCSSLKPNKVKDVKHLQNPLLSFTKYSNYSPINNKQSSIRSTNSNVSQSSIKKLTSTSNATPKTETTPKSSTASKIQTIKKIKPFIRQPIKTLAKLLPVYKEGKI